MFLNKIHTIDLSLDKINSNKNLVLRMKTDISNGDLYILKKAFNQELITKIKLYLINVAKNSLPNYYRIENGAPNSHRLNISDSRSYVKGCFQQFVFYPWNQDYFNLFEKCKSIFHLKNSISGIEKNKFIKKAPDDGCTGRIAVQFYPKGKGYLNIHKDPLDYHQITVPSLTMSKKGTDYINGGSFVKNTKVDIINLDNMLDIGDLVFFNADIPHGVEKIDEGTHNPWLDFKGRWMMLFSVNKLYDNDLISDSIDLN